MIGRVVSGVVQRAFINQPNAKFSEILKRTPLYVVTDTSVGLKGALEVGVKLLPKQQH